MKAVVEALLLQTLQGGMPLLFYQTCIFIPHLKAFHTFAGSLFHTPRIHKTNKRCSRLRSRIRRIPRQ
jgi:hypothetical protein